MAPLIYHWAGGAYEKTARDLKDIYIRSDCIHSGKYDIPFRDALQSLSAPPRSSTSLHRHRSCLLVIPPGPRPDLSPLFDPMAALSPPSACRPQPHVATPVPCRPPLRAAVSVRGRSLLGPSRLSPSRPPLHWVVQM